MRRARRTSPVGVACAAVFLGAFATAAEASPHIALLLAPAVALGLFLAFGLYPGEELLQAWREARAAPRPARRLAPVVRLRPVDYVRPVGHAAAFASAMRPPPATAVRA